MNTQHWDDPHITTAESSELTFISSSRRSFMFLSIWKAFQSFLLCSRNATGQAFETLFPASMCVTYFQRASPGRPCPLAGWLRCQQTQAKPSWGSSDWDWHCVLALLGSAETWQPEISCFAFALQEGEAFLASESSGHYFWPVWEQQQLALQRATSSPHHLEHLKVMPSFGDVKEKWVWRNLAEEGNKDIYPCYPCNSIYSFAWKKTDRNCPLSAKMQFHWDSYKCNSPPQLKKKKLHVTFMSFVTFQKPVCAQQSQLAVYQE